jgi:hypothetical protein
VYAILLPFVGADAARTEYERLQDKLDEREAASRAAAG